MKRLLTIQQQTFTSFPGINIQNYKVLITGASSGIGRETALRFAEQNCLCILVSRRINLLQELKSEIQDKFKNCPEPEILQMDVSNIQDIKNIKSKLKNTDVDILVNNAGLSLGVDKAQNNNIGKTYDEKHIYFLDDAQIVMQTNVMSVIALTRIFLEGMIERGRGHIVNVSSVAGHYTYGGGSVYNASKFALTGFAGALRSDVADTPIRVTNISPGLVETNFSKVRFKGDEQKAKTVYNDIVTLQAIDIADQILYACTRPTRVQIADIITYANNQSGPKEVFRVGEDFGFKNRKQKN